MKILIADDHPIYAEGLRALMESGNYTDVAIVHSGSEAVEAARALQPDVMFMDIRMPGLSGIDAAKTILAELPAIKIIMLTSLDDEESLLEAIRAGVAGYLLKTLSSEDLFRCLADIEEGRNPFSQTSMNAILKQIRRDEGEENGMDGLTERQRTIVTLLAEGLTYKEIGQKLYLAERTVKYHIKSIKEKTGFVSQAQIVAHYRPRAHD